MAVPTTMTTVGISRKLHLALATLPASQKSTAWVCRVSWARKIRKLVIAEKTYDAGHPDQDEPYRRQPPLLLCQGKDNRERRQSTQERRYGERVQPKDLETEEDHEDGADGGPGGDAEDVRVGDGVPHGGLHCCADHRQAGADDGRQEHAAGKRMSQTI